MWENVHVKAGEAEGDFLIRIFGNGWEIRTVAEKPTGLYGQKSVPVWRDGVFRLQRQAIRAAQKWLHLQWLAEQKRGR